MPANFLGSGSLIAGWETPVNLSLPQLGGPCEDVRWTWLWMTVIWLTDGLLDGALARARLMRTSRNVRVKTVQGLELNHDALALSHQPSPDCLSPSYQARQVTLHPSSNCQTRGQICLSDMLLYDTNGRAASNQMVVPGSRLGPLDWSVLRVVQMVCCVVAIMKLCQEVVDAHNLPSYNGQCWQSELVRGESSSAAVFDQCLESKLHSALTLRSLMQNRVWR